MKAIAKTLLLLALLLAPIAGCGHIKPLAEPGIDKNVFRDDNVKEEPVEVEPIVKTYR